MACKGLACTASLSSFRGGPVFPSMFVGAGGIALSHLPGLPTVAGAAMGIGAMCAVLLRLPLTSVLPATLLLGSAGLAVMPLVIWRSWQRTCSLPGSCRRPSRRRSRSRPGEPARARPMSPPRPPGADSGRSNRAFQVVST